MAHRLSSGLKQSIITMIMNSENEAFVIKDNYSFIKIKPKDKKFTLEELQEYVGGYIELYPNEIVSGSYIVCDEEGLLKKRRPNELLFDLYELCLVGNVVIVPKKLFD